ncbi:hypothetical protein [Bauldia sp.]|uniref:hypothetical protein n=1 Tax=Bauldia sp. TaxID=2575872 RepID=UPI003BAC5182
MPETLNGTFDDFLAGLLAFESGWDRPRYEAGIIQDWQLTQWAGGPVTDFFPQYTSWSQLSDAEWEVMAYRSMNSFGFVGFQFGEALLIDLGYYDDDFYYGNGAAANTWDGTWTGKNGVESLEDFMTAAAQNVAIREAFGHNLKIIEAGLAAGGKSLDDYIGTTRSYTQNGVEVSVTLTLTGLLAGAHLRGAPATVTYLLNDIPSNDEFGTSIVQYIDQFGGFDAPAVSELIAYFDDRLTGDEGLGSPGDNVGGGSGNSDNGTANVTAETADVVVTWNWGTNPRVEDFDPATDTIFIDWFKVGELTITDTNDGVLIGIPSMIQTITIVGVSLADLSPANFTVLDGALGATIMTMIGDGLPGDGQGDGGDTPGDGDNDGADGSGDGGTDNGGTGDNNGSGDNAGGGVVDTGGGNGTANVSAATATVVITWMWGQYPVIDGFDPTADTIFVDWFHSGQIEMSETTAGVVIAAPGNNQATTLAGVALADLSPANFTVMDATLGAELFAVISTGDDHGDHGDGSDDSPVMTMVTLTSPSTTIDDFDPSKDMIHIEGGITADRLVVAEANGNTTFTVTEVGGAPISTVTLVGIGLADLDLGNFSIAEQSALNEVAAALGEAIAEPVGTEGKTIIYDADGSNPAPVSGITPEGGVIYRADYFADDIVGFDPAVDRIDFGDTSVHNMIITKAPTGELIIDNPWWTDMQIVTGVAITDLGIETFGVVQNEHFRQDVGGVMSWELGVGPRDDNTVYIRSHEYGSTTVIDDFDPSTMMISFLYYGTRERLSVEDTDQGLVISTYPSGQTFVFTGLELADLNPGNVAFHHDQVIEDNLEVPFGFSANDVTLVSREGLLTPEGPAGQVTDGHQTRVGVGAPDSDTPTDGDGDGSDSGDSGGDGGNTGGDGSSDGGSGGGGSGGDGNQNTGNGETDTHVLTWNWAKTETIADFAASEDVLDFGALPANTVAISEVDGDLLIEVLNNGGHVYVVEDVQAEDLTAANLSAPDWNSVLTASGGVYDQLTALGAEDLL